MSYSIRNLTGKIHNNIPPGLRRTYKFIIGFIRRIIGYYFLPVWFYSIKESESGELFSFVHIGWDGNLRNYWLSRFSGDYEIIPEIRMIAISRIPGFLKKNEQKIDIAIIESSKKVPSGIYPNSFLLPRWIEMELDIESSLKKSRIKNITRNIKKHSLEYEVREGIEAFDLFYRSMYIPYIVKRHEKSARLADYKQYSGKFLNKEAELFFLVRESEPVAAAFVELNKGGYRLSLLGIKDGSDGIFKMGVIGALYYFFMVHYYERDINKLLIGVSMPVLFDGVTESKMQLGAKPYLKDLEGRRKYYFVPVNARPLTFKMLKSNSLFYLSGSALNIALFLSAEDYDTKEEFFKFFNRVKTENVEMTRVFYFDNCEKIIRWLKEEGIAGIEFNKYETDRISTIN